MSTETAAQKDLQKLQRAIVHGLEDVKAQDIQVFNTEKLSPLFERVVVACGSSNRQTKALAASVREAVREAGFSKPRIEGEDNGEWIIVDCGRAVVHIMQPAIRRYYHLEELWGETPVRLKQTARKATKQSTGESSGAMTSQVRAKRSAKKTAVSVIEVATKATTQMTTQSAATKTARKSVSVASNASTPSAAARKPRKAAVAKTVGANTAAASKAVGKARAGQGRGVQSPRKP